VRAICPSYTGGQIVAHELVRVLRRSDHRSREHFRVRSGMHPEFWSERWREGKIGFHEGKPNRFLQRHVGRLGDRRRVLVPLCGKSEDLAFLAAHGHSAVGIELVEDAVRAFFHEHDAAPTITRHAAHSSYTAGAITILAGDFFAVTRELAGAVDAFYDRAALVALPPDMRPRYATQVRSLVPPGSPGLVLSFEYPPEQMQGPPFPVFEPEVRALFGPRIELVDEASDDRVREPPIAATERCWACEL
jgi:thiopurine S-methyltransferase